MADPTAGDGSGGGTAGGEGGPTMTTTTVEPPTYRPHKMERYYAQHILQTHFTTFPTDSTTSSTRSSTSTTSTHLETSSLTDTTPHSIHVTGRDAVPFLTTSGVERTALRHIWNVVDPEGVGTLIKRSQFHVMLRLVALSEAGLLPPIDATINTSSTPSSGVGGAGGQQTPGEILSDALSKFSHLEITLPTFGALETPSAAYLVSHYAEAVKGQEDDGAAGSGSSAGQSAAFDHDYQFKLWQQQQQQQGQYQQQSQMGGGNMMQIQPQMQMGMNNTSMGGMNNMGGTTTTTGVAANNSNVFPTSGAAGLAATSTVAVAAAAAGQGPNSFHSQQPSSNVMSVGDAFADLGPAEDKVLPSDDFGDFEEADDKEEDGGGKEEVQKEEEQKEGVVRPDGNGDEQHQGRGQEEVLMSGGGVTMAEMGSAGDNGQAQTMLGEMEVAPPPLPSGPPPPPPPPPPPQPIEGDNMHMQQQQDEDDDDDDEGFGDFEGTDEPADTIAPEEAAAGNQIDDVEFTGGEQQLVGESPDFSAGGMPSMPPPPPPVDLPLSDAADFGDFGAQAQKQPVSVSDAFASLAPPSDAPLPAEPFGGVADPEHQKETEGENDEKAEIDSEDDDDFGEFEEVASVEVVGGNNHAVIEATAQKDDDEEPMDDTTTPPKQSSLPQLDATAAAFGGFADQPKPLGESAVPVSDDDPFATLGPAENTPLPTEPFGGTDSTANAKVEADSDSEGDEDFGDFEAVESGEGACAAVTTSVEVTSVSVDANEVPVDDSMVPQPDLPPSPVPPQDLEESSDDPFAVLGPSPMPVLSLDSTEPAPTLTVDGNEDDDNDEESDDFGDFEAVGSSEGVDTSAAAAPVEDPSTPADASDGIPPPEIPPFPQQNGVTSLDDPFGVLGSSEDAPLPVLSSEVAPTLTGDGNEANDSDDEGDDFRDFEAVESTEGVGTTVAAAAPSETPTTPADASDGIPAPELPPVPQQDRAEKSNDPFGVLGPSADVPLPAEPFDLAEPVETAEVGDEAVRGDEDNDFGGFEDAGSVEASKDIDTAAFPPKDSKVPSQDGEIDNAMPPSPDLLPATLSLDAPTMPAETSEGGFASTMPMPDLPPPSPQEPTEPSDDPFAVLGPSADAPLPVLSFGSAISAPEVEGGEGDGGNNGEDSFGDFEANSPNEVKNGAGGNGIEAAVAAVPEAKAKEDAMPVPDAFGAFDPAEDAPLPEEKPFGFTEPVANNTAVEEENESGSDGEDFGDFEAVDASPDHVATPEAPSFDGFQQSPLQQQQEKTTPFSDAFGPAETSSTASNNDNDEGSGGGDFGDFKEHQSDDKDVEAASSDAPVQEDQSGAFGQFEAPDSTPTDDPQASSSEDKAKDERFDDFSSFSNAEVRAQPLPHTIEQQNFDAFALPEPDGPGSTGDEKKSVDQPDLFGAFPPTDVPPPAAPEATPPPADEDEDDFGDWGAFDEGEGQDSESFGKPQGPASNIEAIREKVAAKGGVLASDLGNISILECFDQDTSGDVHLATRCCLLYNMLSSTHGDHGMLWVKIIAATNDELAVCKSLLQGMAKGLSRKERMTVAKSEQLRTFFQGLRECVRVVRSIVASIGDLQCLSDDTDLSDINRWRSMDILKEALAVENSWAAMLRAIKKLGLSFDLSLESIPDIRRGSKKIEFNHADPDQHSSMICHLTLRPLAGQAALDWNGSSYMACAANLYANRVSTSAPL